MNERLLTMQQLHGHVIAAKHEIEIILESLGWPNDEILSRTLDRLTELKELSHDDSTQ